MSCSLKVLSQPATMTLGLKAQHALGSKHNTLLARHLLMNGLAILGWVGHKAEAATVDVGEVRRSAVLELVAKRILKCRFHSGNFVVLEAGSIAAARAFEIVVIWRAEVAAILASSKV